MVCGLAGAAVAVTDSGRGLAMIQSGADALGSEALSEAPPDTAPATAWNLTGAQRRAFLNHYAPVLLRGSSEDSGSRGSDWISNFDFDRDRDFSTNKDNWEQIEDFATGPANPSWQVRPTLYSAIVEFMDGDRKSAIMIYHVYNAKQQFSIHDWERVEIRVDDITGDPGSGEQVAYAVLTEHNVNRTLRGGSADLRFMDTPNGHHPIIWQAPSREAGSFDSDFERGELHFVRESWDSLMRATNAVAAVSGSGDQAYHYVFMPEGDTAAVAAAGARPISRANTTALSAGTSSLLSTGDTRRVTYELQDLADIMPTHWDGGRARTHWTDPAIPILLEEPLAGGLDGGPAVPQGLRTFLRLALDDEDNDEDRSGYPTKYWFWGAYEINGAGFTGPAFRDGTPNGTRAVANGDPESLAHYWRQHDYFAHEGASAGTIDEEVGAWLPAGWHRGDAGGFDGRWIELFDDAG
jgi:hypothetical protein